MNLPRTHPHPQLGARIADAPLLTARDVAGICGVSTETILRWVRSGKLPAIKLPSGAIRFRADAVQAWLNDRAFGRAA